jgi:hypothetical protein
LGLYESFVELIRDKARTTGSFRTSLARENGSEIMKLALFFSRGCGNTAVA